MKTANAKFKSAALDQVDAGMCPEETVREEIEKLEQGEFLDVAYELKKNRTKIEKMAGKARQERDLMTQQLEGAKTKNTRVIEETKAHYLSFLKQKQLPKKEETKGVLLEELAKRQALQHGLVSYLKQTLAQLNDLESTIDKENQADN